MKPLNSQEKNKQLWQFVFIFFTLCFLPVCLVFFSFFKTPAALSQNEIQKLVNYSSFEHSQKLLVKEIITMNEDLSKLATNPSDASVLDAKIGKSIANLSAADSGQLINGIKDGYVNYLSVVKKTNDATLQVKKINEQLELEKTKAQNFRDEAIINSNRGTSAQ